MTNGRPPPARTSSATRSTVAARSARSSGRGHVDGRPEQLVESLVRALLPGRQRRAGEDEMDGEPGLRAGRGGEPAMVGPAAAGRDQRVGAVGERRADEELEVPQLVAAEREREQVLALDPDVGVAADGRREPRQALQRRRPVEQREPRQRGDRRGNTHRSILSARLGGP